MLIIRLESQEMRIMVKCRNDGKYGMLDAESQHMPNVGRSNCPIFRYAIQLRNPSLGSRLKAGLN